MSLVQELSRRSLSHSRSGPTSARHYSSHDLLVLPILTAALFGSMFLSVALTGAVPLLKILFPAAAVLCALALHRTTPGAYFAFAWIVFLATPALRRVVDYNEGWDPLNPVVLAPFLVASVSVGDLAGIMREHATRERTALALIFAGITVGFCVGLIRVGVTSAVYGLLEWGTPPLIAAHFLRHASAVHIYRRLIGNLAAVSIIVLSIYGVYQYFYLPAWDASWIRNAPVASVGAAEPGEFRVFSLLNSPGTFATCLALFVLLVLGADRVRGRLPALGIGMLGISLSFVRASWVALAAGACYAFGSTRSSRLTGRALVLLAAISVVLHSGVGSAVASRLTSFADLAGDDSAIARQAFYEETGAQVARDPLGQGLGSTGSATKLENPAHDLGAYGNFDSGLLELPVALGWLGAALFLLGLAVALGAGSRAALPTQVLPFGAVALSAAVFLMTTNVFKGTVGFFFWSCIGLWLTEIRARSPHDFARRLP